MLEGEDGDTGGPGLAMSRKPVAAGAPSHSRCDPTERPSGSWRQQAAQLHQQSSGHSSGTHRRRLPKKNGFGSIMSPSAAAVRHSEATGGTDELDGSQTGHGETDARLEWTATARPRGGVPRQGRMQIARCDRGGIMFAEKFFAENAYNTAALEFSRSRVQVPRGESVSASGNAAVDTW